MKRLTTLRHDRAATIGDMGDLRDLRAVVDSLYAYEMTGLTPDEVSVLAQRRHDCKIECLLEKYEEKLEEVARLQKENEYLRKKRAGLRGGNAALE